MSRLLTLVACALVALAGCAKDRIQIQPQCLAGSVDCGGTCVRLATDAANCGACGNACGPGQVCSGGTCATTCAAPLATCGAGAAASCADTQNDPANCGGCGEACPGGQLCSAGACAPTCAALLATCGTGAGAFCADVRHDPANCGACGTACGDGQVCDGGTCAAACALAGSALCGGACVDLATDVAHCGACGVACGAGTTCAAGQCVPTCPTGQTRCGDRCVDLAADDASCGACGHACPGWAACAAGACTAVSCRGEVGLPGTPDLVGERTFGVAAMDVDHDGKVDLVIAPEPWDDAPQNGTVEVLRNLGGRRFAAPVTYPAGLQAGRVYAGDVNADGIADLFVLGTYSDYQGTRSGITVLRGLAGGGFGSPSAPVAESAYRFEVADLNGDGRSDTVAADDQITIRLASNYGVLGPPTTYWSTTRDVFFLPRSLAVGDVDGDGFPDVVGGELQGGQIGVFLNDGTGHLLPVVVYDVRNEFETLAVADVDGDGDLDLLGAASYPVYGLAVFLNAGDGTFGAPTYYEGAPLSEILVVGDFDGDGHPDAALSSFGGARRVDVYRNAGDGTFEPPVPHYDARIDALAAADLDGDARPDLAIASSLGGVHLLWNEGAASFSGPQVSPSPTGAWEFALADVDGDGRLDALVTEGDHQYYGEPEPTPGRVAVLKGAGDGRFEAAQVIAAPTVGHTVAGDLDGDGDADVMFDVEDAYGAGVVRVYRSEDGALVPAGEIADAAGSLALADLDRDGALDLATARSRFPAAPELAWARGHGDGTFDPVAPLATLAQAPLALKVADVDGNGWPDVIAFRPGGPVEILRNLGGGAWISSSVALPEGSGGDLAVGDLDGDGVVDLAVCDHGVYGDGEVVVLSGRGDGTFVAGAPIAYPYAERVYVGAPDGRARNVVLVIDTFGETIGVVEVGPGGALALRGRWALGGGGVALAIGDADGDLRPDVVAGGPNRVSTLRATCLP